VICHSSAPITPGSPAAEQLMRKAEEAHRFSALYADGLRTKAFAIEQREAKPIRVLATKKVV
jgi:hypothetical protein